MSCASKCVRSVLVGVVLVLANWSATECRVILLSAPETRLSLPENRLIYGLNSFSHDRSANKSSSAFIDSALSVALGRWPISGLRRAFDAATWLNPVQGPSGEFVDVSYLRRWYEVIVADSVDQQAFLSFVIDTLNLWAETPSGITWDSPNSTESREPIDPYWYSQSAYMGSGSGSWRYRLQLPGAWGRYTGDTSVVVGDLNDGLAATHEDLAGRRILGDHGGIGSGPHGTPMMSIIMAKTDNDTGMAGVMWNGTYGSYTLYNGAPDADYQYERAIAGGCQIVSSAFYIEDPESWFPYPCNDLHKPLYSGLAHEKYAAGYQAGVINISSAGNLQGCVGDITQWPAAFPRIVIAFSAMDANGFRSPDASVGSWVDFTAPGEGIVACNANGGYLSGSAAFSGTSAACAFGAGMAGLLYGFARQNGDTLDGDDVFALFKCSARKNGPAGDWNAERGYGIPNADSALALLARPNTLTRMVTSGNWTETVESPTSKLAFGIPGISDGTYIVRPHVLRKWVPNSQEYFVLHDVWANGRKCAGALTEGTLVAAQSGDVTFWSAAGCSVRTCWYEVYDLMGNPCPPWPPTQTQGARVAFTADGEFLMRPTAIQVDYDTSSGTATLWPGTLYPLTADVYEYSVQVDQSGPWSVFRSVPARQPGVGVQYDSMPGSEYYAFGVRPKNIHQYPVFGSLAYIQARPNRPESVTAGVEIWGYMPVIPASMNSFGEVGTNMVDPDPGTTIYTTSVQVSWAPPLNQARPPHHYSVEAWDSTYHLGGWPPHQVKNVNVFDNITGTSTTICLPKRDQNYEITVYAWNESGLWSQGSTHNYITTGCYRLNDCGGGGCMTIFPPDRRPVASSEFGLSQNTPNPFNSGTLVRYSLDVDGEVDLEVYNVLGQKVATLSTGRQSSGDHEIQWNGNDDNGTPLSSGLYMLRLTSSGKVASRKLAIVK